MEKFKVVASEHGRSANKEIEMLMKQAAEDYEQNNGLIDVSALQGIRIILRKKSFGDNKWDFCRKYEEFCTVFSKFNIFLIFF